MVGMTSSAVAGRSRKRPEERREEILAHAADIALEEGLERITLRAVADRLGVRPGLITHYYPAAEDLVIEAFVRAAEVERERFFPASGSPLERLAHFVGYIESGTSASLARLWLNARHLSRFGEALRDVLDEQDALDRERMVALLADGVASGDIGPVDVEVACIRIFIAVDGGGSYVNSAGDVGHPAHRHFLSDVTEWTLGLAPGTLRRLIAAERTAADAGAGGRVAAT
jgi:AcrR family transcriptional regulator